MDVMFIKSSPSHNFPHFCRKPLVDATIGKGVWVLRMEWLENFGGLEMARIKRGRPERIEGEAVGGIAEAIEGRVRVLEVMVSRLMDQVDVLEKGEARRKMLKAGRMRRYRAKAREEFGEG